ncbi:hypothetical protein SRABI83_03670 [Arthrobacter sp. Bi83]|nr:hypothetical protein SRABI83_03670 [Arthrobacter sp. Bi83]
MARCLPGGDKVEPMGNESTMSVRLDPLHYPWDPPEASGVVLGEDFLPLGLAADLNAVLSGADAAPLGARSLVVSIGSNSSPDVMRRKFANYGQPVSRILPMVRGRLHNIGVGHSAHVSTAGYIAAAPYSRTGKCTTVWVSWLDEGQLLALDATEHNYRRLELNGKDCGLVLDNGERPATFSLYASSWGVLNDGHGAELPLMDQPALFGLLAGSLTGRDLEDEKSVFEGPPERVVEQLALASVQAGAKDWFRSAGLVTQVDFDSVREG